MADNVVYIAFDADAKKQQEQLFIRLFQILDHEICRAKGNGAPQSAILQGAFHALLAAWAENGAIEDEEHNIRLFTQELNGSPMPISTSPSSITNGWTACPDWPSNHSFPPAAVENSVSCPHVKSPERLPPILFANNALLWQSSARD
jgi:hypothetical protein